MNESFRTYMSFPSTTRIEAYAYEAATYCRDCMWEIAFGWNIDGFETSDTTENLLDRAAEVRGIDRQDEGTFNSCQFPDSTIPVFPKVVFLGQLCDEGHESCDGCGIDLCQQ